MDHLLKQKMVHRSVANLRRVNVGCGPTGIREDWWNIDIIAFDGIDQIMDATEPWPWCDALDFVYGEHFLEHLWLEDAIRFLQHAGNSLVPGGRLRISTPSLEWVLASHFSLGFVSAERHVRETFAMNRAFHGWGHRFLFSKAMLQYVLSRLGYVHLEFFNFGESNTDALCGLERHGSWVVQQGYPNTWIVEAERPEKNILIPADLNAEIEENISRYVRSRH